MLTSVTFALMLTILALSFCAWRSPQGVEKAIMINSSVTLTAVLIAIAAVEFLGDYALDIAFVFVLAGWVYAVVFYHPAASKHPEDMS